MWHRAGTTHGSSPFSDRAHEDARLPHLIRASFTASQGIYGAPRVFLDLREAGETCSKPRVARLMRVNHLRALRGYRTRRWAVGKPAVLIPNLPQRQFTVTRRNKAWVTNITYIRTWQGWLYLAVVMDLFSRKIVGWVAGPTIHRELVLDAVLMAPAPATPSRHHDSFGPVAKATLQKALDAFRDQMASADGSEWSKNVQFNRDKFHSGGCQSRLVARRVSPDVQRAR